VQDERAVRDQSLGRLQSIDIETESVMLVVKTKME
jgi:hypothetical protein